MQQVPDAGPPRLMRAVAAAKYLGLSYRMLREEGPEPLRIGRSFFYERAQLDRWVATRPRAKRGRA